MARPETKRKTMSDAATPSPPKILLWGGKGKARILDAMLVESGLGATTLIFDAALERPGFETSAFFTNDPKVLKQHLHRVTHYVTCIGGEHGYARVMTSRYLELLGLQSIPLIHHTCFVEPGATIGAACQFMPRAVVHKFVQIGDHTILNTNCTIDHECRLGQGVHVMGGAAIAGCVTIGAYATIGTNATVMPGLMIGEGAYVGAGAVVNRDVEAYTVVAGVPAKRLREHHLTFYEDALKVLCG